MLDKQTAKEIALSCGFKLKEQENGEMDLNDYVYATLNKVAEHCWSAWQSGVMPHKIHPTKASLNNGWISVDDELPNHNDFCKVITIYDDLLDCQFFNYIDDGKRIIGFSWVNELDIDKNGKFTYSDVENSFGINDAKYFIVLPNPPKE